jgi:hypothetical protein
VFSEAFIVCENYSPPEDFVPTMNNPLLAQTFCDFSQLTGANRIIVPFLACGDLSAYDADTTYPLDVSIALFYCYWGNLIELVQATKLNYLNHRLYIVDHVFIHYNY